MTDNNIQEISSLISGYDGEIPGVSPEAVLPAKIYAAIALVLYYEQQQQAGQPIDGTVRDSATSYVTYTPDSEIGEGFVTIEIDKEIEVSSEADGGLTWVIIESIGDACEATGLENLNPTIRLDEQAFIDGRSKEDYYHLDLPHSGTKAAIHFHKSRIANVIEAVLFKLESCGITIPATQTPTPGSDIKTLEGEAAPTIIEHPYKPGNNSIESTR